MKTPKEYVKNLKNGVITDDMISDVLFSYSKRAKNYRDNARELRQYFKRNSRWGCYDQYDAVEKNNFKKEVLYERKSDILNKCGDRFLKCIHKQDKHTTRRIYDYEYEFNKVCDSDAVVWSNCYYDHDREEEVYFVDIEKENKEYLYFLYYEMPNRSFHSPIDEDEAIEIAKEKNLEIIELDELVTYGEDVGLLLSLQFCDKVYKFLFPDKTVYKISQPIDVSFDYFEYTHTARFYTDEELKAYRDKKKAQREEAERIRAEKKQKREEEKLQKKLEEEKHYDELFDLIVNKSVCDWSVISEHIIENDKMFNKLFRSLDKEKKNILIDNCLASILGNSEDYDCLVAEINNCHPEYEKLLSSIIDFMKLESVISNKEKKYIKAIERRLGKLYSSMIDVMLEYNKNVDDEKKIRFFKNDFFKLRLFSNIPLFEKFTLDMDYKFEEQTHPELFKPVKTKYFRKHIDKPVISMEKFSWFCSLTPDF